VSDGEVRMPPGYQPPEAGVWQVEPGPGDRGEAEFVRELVADGVIRLPDAGEVFREATRRFMDRNDVLLRRLAQAKPSLPWASPDADVIGDLRAVRRSNWRGDEDGRDEGDDQV